MTSAIIAAINQVNAGQCNSGFLANSLTWITVYANHTAPPNHEKKKVNDCDQHEWTHAPVEITENIAIMKGICRCPLIIIILHAIKSCTGVEAATYQSKRPSINIPCLIFRTSRGREDFGAWRGFGEPDNVVPNMSLKNYVPSWAVLHVYHMRNKGEVGGGKVDVSFQVRHAKWGEIEK
jgi:hypothetical protein